MANYEVYLRDTRNGFSGVHKTEARDDEQIRYMYEEGYFGCVCNRPIFLYDDEEKELDCNAGENLIVVDKIVNVDTGAIVYYERMH